MAPTAICVLDRTPRTSLSEEKRAALQELAREAMVAMRESPIRTEFAPEAVEHIVSQMRAAAKDDDETLLLALDRIVQMLEQELTVPLPHDWLDEPLAPGREPRRD